MLIWMRTKGRGNTPKHWSLLQRDEKSRCSAYTFSLKGIKTYFFYVDFRSVANYFLYITIPTGQSWKIYKLFFVLHACFTSRFFNPHLLVKLRSKLTTSFIVLVDWCCLFFRVEECFSSSLTFFHYFHHNTVWS